MEDLIIVTQSSLYRHALKHIGGGKAYAKIINLDEEGFSPFVSAADVRAALLRGRDPLNRYKMKMSLARRITFLVGKSCLVKGGLFYGFLNRVFDVGFVSGSSQDDFKNAIEGVEVSVLLHDKALNSVDSKGEIYKWAGLTSCDALLDLSGMNYQIKPYVEELERVEMMELAM